MSRICGRNRLRPRHRKACMRMLAVDPLRLPPAAAAVDHNKPLKAWSAALDDYVLAEAILGRVVGRGHTVALAGPSMRMRHLGALATSADRWCVAPTGIGSPRPTVPVLADSAPSPTWPVLVRRGIRLQRWYRSSARTAGQALLPTVLRIPDPITFLRFRAGQASWRTRL